MREFCHDYHVVAIDMRFACTLCVCLYVCVCVHVCVCTVCMCTHMHLHVYAPSYLLFVHVCLCCRGYGETEKPPLTSDYKIQNLAQDIAQLVSFYTNLGL